MPFPFLFAAAAVSTGLQVWGGIQASNAEAAAIREEARNRDIMARETLRRGRINAELARREGERFMGSQQASYVAGGVDMSTGSPLLKMQETAFLIAEDVSRIQSDAAVEARMLRSGAASLRGQAGDVRRAGRIGALGSGASNVFSLTARLGAFESKGSGGGGSGVNGSSAGGSYQSYEGVS